MPLFIMKTIKFTIFSILLSLSFLTPTFTPPWNTFSMEAIAILLWTFFISTEIFQKKTIYVSKCLIFFLSAVTIGTITILFSTNKYLEDKIFFLSYTYTAVLVFLYSSNFNKKDDLKKIIAITLLATALCSCIIQIFQYLNSDNISSIWISSYSSDHGRPYANFNQPNNAGTFNLIGLLALIFLSSGVSTNKKIIYFAIPVLLLSIGIAFASSKTTYLSILIIIFIGLISKYKNVYIILTITIFISFSINQMDWFIQRDYTSHGITTLRYELWRDIVTSLKNSSFLGFGANGTSRAFFEIADSAPTKWDAVISNSHNVLLEMLIWFGVVPGLAICTCLIISFAMFFIQKRRDYFYLLALPIAIHSLLEFPYMYANFLFLQIFLMGLSEAEIKKKLEIKKIYLISLFALITLAFIIIYIEYTELREKYTELRFYENKFNSSSKPNPLILNLVDKTSIQYNFFLKNNSITKNEIEDLETLTKISPTNKNFHLIIIYYKKERNLEKFNYWKIKALAIIPSSQNDWFKKISID